MLSWREFFPNHLLLRTLGELGALRPQLWLTIQWLLLACKGTVWLQRMLYYLSLHLPSVYWQVIFALRLQALSLPDPVCSQRTASRPPLVLLMMGHSQRTWVARLQSPSNHGCHAWDFHSHQHRPVTGILLQRFLPAIWTALRAS